MTVKCAVGIDIGGTKIAVGLVTPYGELLFPSRRPTPASEGASAVVQTILQLAREVKEQAAESGRSPVGVGIATGGQVDVAAQRVVGATELLPGWNTVLLRERVEEAIGLPACMDNDAKAVARAELRWGNARDCRHAVFVTLGTGVGGAVAVDGRVVDGARGFAGHIGHVVVEPGGAVCSCGRRGCLEIFASARGIVRLARQYAGEGPVDIEDATDVFRRALEGSSWAERALQEAASALADVLASVIHLLNPEAIVIGGGLSAWGEAWRKRVEEAIVARLMPAFRDTFEVRLAAFGPDAGILGAGALAFDKLTER